MIVNHKNESKCLCMESLIFKNKIDLQSYKAFSFKLGRGLRNFPGLFTSK